MAVFVISHALSNLGSIETVNTAALTMFGYNKRDMIGKNISVVVPPPMNARHDTYLRRFLDTGRLAVSCLPLVDWTLASFRGVKCNC
jgi:PAS domain S-box-containing protein